MVPAFIGAGMSVELIWRDKQSGGPRDYGVEEIRIQRYRQPSLIGASRNYPLDRMPFR